MSSRMRRDPRLIGRNLTLDKVRTEAARHDYAKPSPPSES
jgi:hypothetical protein